MIRAVRIEPEALDELEAAITWYDEQRSGLGGDLLGEVRAMFGALAARQIPSLAAGRAKNGAAVRRVLLARFPYSLVFVEHDAVIRVVAVAHHKRRPGYWRRRLRPA